MREKTKKQQATKYLICLLAILMLALIAITGAWFTDSKTGEEVKVNFGEIKIELGEGSTAIVLNADNETVTRDIMPDDTLRVSMLVGKAADTEDFYWKAKATVTIAGTSTTLDSGWSTETYNTKEDTSAVTIDFKLSGDIYGNDYENKTVTIGYEVRAIQMANLTKPQADYAIENNSEQVFARGEDLVMDSSEVASEGLKFSTATLMDISALSAASIAEVGNVGVEESSTGLVYVVDSEDDTTATECFLVGLGTCTDTEIIVPKYDDLGRKVVGVVGSAVDYANILGIKIEGNVDTTIKSITLPNSIKYIDSGAFACMSASINLDELKNLEYIGYGAFAMSAMSQVAIPSSVTAIGENAFAYSPYLSEVTMSSGITEIGKAAFYNCTNLTSINVPSTVKTVGEGAFQNCSNLQAVRLGGGITEIPYGLFYDCKALSSVILPNNLTTIGTWAFGNCSNLTSVSIPASVISIEYAAFNGCTSLSDVTLSNGLKTIGDYAFWCCNMYSIEIPDTVTTMGTYAFAYCSALKDVKLSSGLTVLNEWSFAYCTNLQTIIFTKSIKTVNTSAFNESSLNIIYYTGNSSEWASTTINTYNDALINARVYYYSETYLDTGWRYVNNVPTRWSNASEGLEFAVLTTYSSVSEVSAKSDIVGTAECIGIGTCTDLDIVIPSTCIIENKIYSVTQIGDSAFSNIAITSIELPRELTKIGNEAFYKCTSLATVTIPEGAELAMIGAHVFQECTVLSNIEIPNSVTSLGEYVFCGCESLISIKVPSGVTNIGEYAFDECTKLKTIIFEEGAQVTSIGYSAFGSCSQLESIVMPSKVTSIGGSAFDDCIRLKSVTFEKDSELISIGQMAFHECGALESFEIPAKVDNVGAYAFRYCRSLKNLVVSNSVTIIGQYAFYECEALETLTFEKDSKLTTIDSHAFNLCQKLTSLEIPNSVTSIGDLAFYGCGFKTVIFEENSKLTNLTGFSNCKSLKTIEIPSSVTSISGFSNSGLETITFEKDSKLTTIKSNAFKSCKSLKRIALPSTVTTIEAHAFSRCTAIETVYYGGTESDWSLITIDNSGVGNNMQYSNNYFINATRYYYSETDTGADNIWHYVEGIPTVW